jgi:hypothetical protein
MRTGSGGKPVVSNICKPWQVCGAAAAFPTSANSVAKRAGVCNFMRTL